jgi:branched-chain amino acid transport system permease protein
MVAADGDVMGVTFARRLGGWRRTASSLAAPAVILAVQLAFFGMPLGLWLRGVVLGLLTALLAIGLALVYRANRVVNFAQADLGSAPVALGASLLLFWGWSYWVGLGIGALGAIVLGALVEITLIRRFRHASRMILTVATIGIASLLVALALVTPRLWDRELGSERISVPLDWRFDVNGVVLSANDLFAAIVAPAAMIAVAWFLAGTRTGLAIRAAAERGDRAAMLGIPVGRLSTIVWSMAALLSFLALWLRAGVLGIPLGGAIHITALVQALAALVIGRMARLPTIALTAVTLGVLEYGIRWTYSDPRLADPLMAAAVLVALLLQPRQNLRRDTDVTSTWQGVEPIRPLPTKVRRLPVVRVTIAALVAAGAIGLWMIPTLLRVDQVIKATAVVVFAVICLSLVVLTGWAGQISLGQFAFVAIGAAVASTCTSRWNVDLTLALVAGGAAGALAAFLVGLPALRLRGLYLAVTTLAFALAVQSWVLNDASFHWFPRRDQRLDRPPLFGRISVASSTAYFWYVVAVAVVVFAAVVGIRRSRTGRVIVAVRENERGAQAFAVSVVRAKLTAFTISGACAGVAGGLFVHLNQSFNLESYGPGQSLDVFVASVVGGLGTVAGAAFGALFLRGTQWFITSPEWRFLSSAAGVLLVLLILPGGLVSLFVKLRDVAVRAVLRRTPDVAAEDIGVGSDEAALTMAAAAASSEAAASRRALDPTP